MSDILKWLSSKGEYWEVTKRPRAAKRLPTIPYSPMPDHDIDRHCLHSGEKTAFEEDLIIKLEPPDEDIRGQAGLWARWHLDKPNPEFRFYLGIWSDHAAFPPSPMAARPRVRGFLGYRFESPEIFDGDDVNFVGNHAYTHMQPNRTMGDRAAYVDFALPGSDKSPTVPLPASGPVELLLCIVLSLYGHQGLEEMSDVLFNTANRPLKEAINKIKGLGVKPRTAVPA